MAKTRRDILRLSLLTLWGGLGPGFLSSGGALAQEEAGRRSLIVYFSRTGHTRTIAEQIRARVAGDVIELQTAEPYPDDYDTLVEQVRQEAAEGYLPPLATTIDNLADYDTVIVGSPIWGNRLSRPVHSFLAGHDLSGRVVAPFITYEVSRSGGEAPRQLQALCPNTDMRQLLAILGEDAALAEERVAAWLEDNRLIAA
jgi:flavodoxin